MIRITVSGQEIYVGEDGIIEVDTDYQGEVPDVPDEPPEPVSTQFQSAYSVPFGTITSSGGIKKDQMELWGYNEMYGSISCALVNQGDEFSCSMAEAGGGVLFQSIGGLRQRWAGNSAIINKLNATGLKDTAWIPTPKDGYAQSGFQFHSTALVEGTRCDLVIESDQNPDGTLWFNWVEPDADSCIPSFTRVQGGANMDLRYFYPAV